MRGEQGPMSRHPLDDALRTSEARQEPAFLLALSDYGLVCSPLKTKMWVKNVSGVGTATSYLTTDDVRVLAFRRDPEFVAAMAGVQSERSLTPRSSGRASRTAHRDRWRSE